MDKIDADIQKLFIEGDEHVEKHNFCTRLSTKLLKRSYDRCSRTDVINGIYIQTIFAAAMLQHVAGISHNDLKTDNVFVEFVNENTIFKGQSLINAQYYSYVINGKPIYFPAIPLIAKIGDFGISVKYTEPIVGDYTVFENGYDQYDGSGPWVPNYPISSYDALFFTTSFITNTTGFDSREMTELIKQCIFYMVPGLNFKKFDVGSQLVNMAYINPKNHRPVLENIRIVRGALDLLENPILKYTSQKYKPSAGDVVVNLGILNV